VIGVDLGGTKIGAVVADRAGNIYASVRVPTEVERGPEAVIDRMLACIAEMRSAVPSDGPLLGVGVGSPGPLDPETGIVLMAPNMPGWRNVPLRDEIATRSGLPVELGNDANAAALGEWLFGGGRGLHHVVYITVSTGIGAGVIMDGRLLLGRQGAGTELGQVLVDRERMLTWEQMASGTALATAAAAAMRVDSQTLLHQYAAPETVTAVHVAQAAAAGDALAGHLMDTEATLLGIGFTNALHLFSPEIVLVGGGVVLANSDLLDGARAVVQQHVIDALYRAVPIEVAHLGEQVGVLGAAALMFYQHPQGQTG
jgi:glucokinase